jgi:4-hydroxy-tetrahydrodipicolinate synthase
MQSATIPTAWSGVFSVLPTPFDHSGALDLDSLARVIALYLRAGVDGLVVLGVTSEAARLNDAERLQVIESAAAAVEGRVPLVVGASADGVRRAIEYSRAARDAGASAVLVSPPRLARPTADAVVGFYTALAEAVDLPLVVQDYPPVCGFTMEPALLVRVALQVASVAAIKLEDPPTPWKIARIRDLGGPQTPAILGGLGGVYLLEELEAGASGTMTGFAYPEILVHVVQLWNKGQREEAAGWFYRYVPLMRFEFQEGIGIALRKEILRRRGALREATIRPPGLRPDASTLASLERLLGWLREQGGAEWSWD